MLILKKSVKGIEIATRDIAPYISRDLLYAFLIALALHILPITLFTIKKLYFSYSDPIIQAITIAPSLHQLEISTDSAYFPAPPLPKYERIRLPEVQPISAGRLLSKTIKPYSLSDSLADRLITPTTSLPETYFVKIQIKVDDKTGKIFFYETPQTLSKELHQWIMDLNFEIKPGSFATSGILEIDSRVKHD